MSGPSNTVAAPADDDLRGEWWYILGLIEALEIVNNSGGQKEREARGGVITALERAARSFSPLVEAAADGTPYAGQLLADLSEVRS